MKKIILLGVLMALFTGTALAGGTPVPNFSANKLQVNVGESIDFTDLSRPNACGNAITNWDWNFGSGAASPTSTMQNPSNSYNTPGLKTVSLTVTTNINCMETETKIEYIEVLRAAPAEIPTMNWKRLFLYGALIFGAAVFFSYHFIAKGSQ